MPRDTWWWVGIGTAAAATVVGGILVYRHRGAAGLGGPEGAPAPFPPPQPPVPPVPEPDPTSDFGFGAPDPILSEICRQWQVGQNKPSWGAEHVAIYRAVIQDVISERQPTWADFAEFIDERFLITRATLDRLCPNMRLPNNRAMVQVLKQQEGFYWQELWDRLQNAVNEALVAYGS